MKFTKMQGIGNDYVYVNAFVEQIDDPSALAIAISDRHFGVGGDGLVMICPSSVAQRSVWFIRVVMRRGARIAPPVHIRGM